MPGRFYQDSSLRRYCHAALLTLLMLFCSSCESGSSDSDFATNGAFAGAFGQGNFGPGSAGGNAGGPTGPVSGGSGTPVVFNPGDGGSNPPPPVDPTGEVIAVIYAAVSGSITSLGVAPDGSLSILQEDLTTENISEVFLGAVADTLYGTDYNGDRIFTYTLGTRPETPVDK